MYLKLFHGRADPTVSLDDWGEEGPIFGPMSYVHTTYAADIKFEVGEDMCELLIIHDMVYYDGMYYGDWSVFEKLEAGTPLTTFNLARSRPVVEYVAIEEV